jgi:1-acyl-sn-glycerol-3-phosphate acyltransferase
MGFTYAAGYQLSKFIAQAFFDLQVFGQDNMIDEGPALLAMNHQSFLDPPFAGICCNREIFFLARKTLFDVPVLGFLLKRINVIGVDREGSDVGALKAVIRVLRAGGCTIVFPEGTRTRDGNLLPARPGAGLIIAKTLAPVIPMRIFGAHEAFPKGAKLPQLHPITIVIGEPMRFNVADVAGDPRTVFQCLSERVMDRIAALRNPRDADS